MPMRDEIGMRMKANYESVSKSRLMRRTPVSIRIDGKAFHTFTRGFQKPFDGVLMRTMQETMKYLCENIQGCVLGYTQSDEITLILVDYQKLTSDAWFDYEVQKMCSISASMTAMKFNMAFRENVTRFCADRDNGDTCTDQDSGDSQMKNVYRKAVEKGAVFDARCFNVPKEEVTNLIYWRQLDATRNSIQMVGQANFSHRELQGKSCNEIQDMLMTEKGINWNDFPVCQKRGSCCIKRESVGQESDGGWVIDLDIPIFKGEDREYIDRLIYVGEE